MADAIGVTAVDRLGDGLRRPRPRPACTVMPRLPSSATSNAAAVHAGRPARLSAGEVERHHAAVAVGTDSRAISSEIGGIVVPQRAVDDPGHDPEVALAPRQAGQLRLERPLHA